MKFLSTILAGALAIGTSMLGCSSDEEQAPAGGASGTGTGATGGAGSGGKGGSSGTAGSAGSAGADARIDAAIQCNSAAGVQECKRIGNEENICSSLVDCSCNKCTCLLAECEALPTCLALRRCALDKGCCSPSLYGCQPQGCCTGVDCTQACMTEITAAAEEPWDGGTVGTNAFQLALALDTCVYIDNDAGAKCTPCPLPDAGRDAASGG